MSQVAQDSPDVSARRLPTSAEDAVTWIVGEHAAAMLAYATQLTKDRVQAEDIVQEALIRAWRSWERLDKLNGSLRGWLLTVVRNLVIDICRARSTRASETYLSNWDGIGPSYMDRSTIEDRAELSELLAILSPEERAVLVEVYLRDRSVEQAAETLGIAPGTVKSRTYYALRKLRPGTGETARTETVDGSHAARQGRDARIRAAAATNHPADTLLVPSRIIHRPTTAQLKDRDENRTLASDGRAGLKSSAGSADHAAIAA